MRETEIVRGLGKARTKHNAQLAKANSYATGMVPDISNAGIKRGAGSMVSAGLGALATAKQYLDPGRAARVEAADAQTAVDKAAKDAANQEYWRKEEQAAAAPKVVQTEAARQQADIAARNQAYLAKAAADRAAATPPGYSRGTPFLHGPGTGTSDSIPANLSRGEAVLPAKTVQKVGAHNIARLIQDTNDGVAPKTGLRAGGNYNDGLIAAEKLRLAMMNVGPLDITDNRAPIGETLPGDAERKWQKANNPAPKVAPVAPTVTASVTPTATASVTPTAASVTPTATTAAAERNGLGKLIDKAKAGVNNVVDSVKNMGNVTPDTAAASTAQPGLKAATGPTKPAIVSSLASDAEKLAARAPAPAPVGTPNTGAFKPTNPLPLDTPTEPGTDRAYNEAKAQKANIGAKYTPPAGGTPAAGPAPKPQGILSRAGSALAGSKVAKVAGKLAVPLALADAAVATGSTPTEQYRERFGFGESDEGVAGLVGDIGVRALGAASDLGNTLTFGQAGRLFRDKQAQAARDLAAGQAEKPALAPQVQAPVDPAAERATQFEAERAAWLKSQGIDEAARSQAPRHMEDAAPGLPRVGMDQARVGQPQRLPDGEDGAEMYIRTAAQGEPAPSASTVKNRDSSVFSNKDMDDINAGIRKRGLSGATLTGYGGPMTPEREARDAERAAQGQELAASYARQVAALDAKNAGGQSEADDRPPRAPNIGNMTLSGAATAKAQYRADRADFTARNLSKGQNADRALQREATADYRKEQLGLRRDTLNASIASAASARETAKAGELRESVAASERSEKAAADQLEAEIPRNVPGPDGKGSVSNPEYTRFVADARHTVAQLGSNPATEHLWKRADGTRTSGWGDLDGPQRAKLLQMRENRARVEEATKRPGSKWLLGTFNASSRDLTEYDFTQWKHGKGADAGYVVSPSGKSKTRVDDLQSTEVGNYIWTEMFKDKTDEFTGQLPENK